MSIEWNASGRRESTIQAMIKITRFNHLHGEQNSIHKHCVRQQNLFSNWQSTVCGNIQQYSLISVCTWFHKFINIVYFEHRINLRGLSLILSLFIQHMKFIFDFYGQNIHYIEFYFFQMRLIS